MRKILKYVALALLLLIIVGGVTLYIMSRPDVARFSTADGVLSVQAPGVLLQRALPGHRHREDQGVERRVIESLANQLAGGQKDARRVGR